MELTSGAVHLWLAVEPALSDPAVHHDLERTLSAGERARMERLRVESRRDEYRASHALLRRTLSRYADVAPAAWRFRDGSHGKPRIDDPALDPPLHFNLSHTRGMAVVAIARQPVGVDAEWTGRRGRTVSVARRYFSPTEVDELLALGQADQRNRFFDLWTLKEAYIKACGYGLAIPLDHFSFRFPTSDRVQIEFSPEREDDPARWAVRQFSRGEHRVAVAIRSAGPEPRVAIHHTTPATEAFEIETPRIRSSQRPDT